MEYDIIKTNPIKVNGNVPLKAGVANRTYEQFA